MHYNTRVDVRGCPYAFLARLRLIVRAKISSEKGNKYILLQEAFGTGTRAPIALIPLS